MADSDRLIVGLGNPGKRYEETRHNIGFTVIDSLAKLWRLHLSSSHGQAIYGGRQKDGDTVYLAKPMNYMNRSGPPVLALSSLLEIPCRNIIVIHDDMDLDFGRIKIKTKGGHGGHKGISSLLDAFGDDDFVRLRIGIGRPMPGIDVIDHVLGKFMGEEVEGMDAFMARARDAVVTILCEGAVKSMAIFNRKESGLT